MASASSIASSVHEPVQRRWNISGACLSRPTSSVSDGVVVVIVDVDSRCRVGELDGVDEVSRQQIEGEEVILRENSRPQNTSILCWRCKYIDAARSFGVSRAWALAS